MRIRRHKGPATPFATRPEVIVLMRHLLLSLVLATATTGCGGKSSVETVPVSGLITMDGDPLVNAAVMFQLTSDTEVTAPTSAGITDDEGRYTLKVSISDTTGAVVGEHRVSVTMDTYEEDDDDDSDTAVNEPIPNKYNVNTELIFNVPENGTDQANFELQSE
jgi:hypothetical protein